MKVAFDGGGLSRPESGTGRYTLELLRGLARAGSGDRVTVFFNDRTRPRPDVTLPEGMDLVNPGWPDRMLRPMWERLGWPPVERFVGEADVFHASDWIHPPLRRAALVATVHDVGPLQHPEWYAPDVAARHRAIHRSLVDRGARVVTVSEFTRRELLALGGLPEDRVHAVASGVSRDFRPVDGARAVAARRGLDRPFVLYVGTREPRKNLMGLVDAFGRVAERVADVDLALVGVRPRLEARAVQGVEAWVGDELEERVAGMGLTDRVRVVGQVPRVDLPALYTAAAVFAFPTLYEGFGLPILEAMACGTPVVASDRTAVPEVAGDAAVLVDPTRPEALAEALIRVLRSPEETDRLRAAGRARAATFSWDRTAKETRSVYERAAEAR